MRCSEGVLIIFSSFLFFLGLKISWTKDSRSTEGLYLFFSIVFLTRVLTSLFVVTFNNPTLMLHQTDTSQHMWISLLIRAMKFAVLLFTITCLPAFVAGKQSALSGDAGLGGRSSTENAKKFRSSGPFLGLSSNQLRAGADPTKKSVDFASIIFGPKTVLCVASVVLAMFGLPMLLAPDFTHKDLLGMTEGSPLPDYAKLYAFLFALRETSFSLICMISVRLASNTFCQILVWGLAILWAPTQIYQISTLKIEWDPTKKAFILANQYFFLAYCAISCLLSLKKKE